VCICSHRYPDCNVHAPYCHLWPARLYYIFPHHLITARCSKIVIGRTVCVFIFSTPFSRNISHSKNNWAIYDQNTFSPFMSSTRYPCQIFTKLEFSRPIFEKCSNIKFPENPFIVSRIVPCGETDGQTDRQTYMAKLIVSFRNFSNEPKTSAGTW